MRTKRNLIIISVSTVLLFACAYIVTPQPDVTPTSAAANGWTALVTAVGKSDSGDLHVDITIRNETQDWSSMQASANKPAVLTSGGKTSNCDTVFVGTGGNYLAPGFQMRGYTGGTRAEPKDQLLYVECKGATAEPGSKLSVQYSYVTGPFNYYVTANPTNAQLDLDLDQVSKDLKYPVVELHGGADRKSRRKHRGDQRLHVNPYRCKAHGHGAAVLLGNEEPGDLSHICAHWGAARDRCRWHHLWFL